MTPATLDEGAAKLAARNVVTTSSAPHPDAYLWYQWCDKHGAQLIAAARQAQDNAKDAWQPIATAPTDDWVRCDLWLKIYPSPRSFGMADSFRVVEAYRIDGKWVHRHEGKVQELYAPYITHWMLTPSEPDAAIAAATPGKRGTRT